MSPTSACVADPSPTSLPGRYGHVSGGALAGGSPTSSASRLTRRRPLIRSAGPEALSAAPTMSEGRPTPASARCSRQRDRVLATADPQRDSERVPVPGGRHPQPQTPPFQREAGWRQLHGAGEPRGRERRQHRTVRRADAQMLIHRGHAGRRESTYPHLGDERGARHRSSTTTLTRAVPPMRTTWPGPASRPARSVGTRRRRLDPEK